MLADRRHPSCLGVSGAQGELSKTYMPFAHTRIQVSVSRIWTAYFPHAMCALDSLLLPLLLPLVVVAFSSSRTRCTLTRSLMVSSLLRRQALGSQLDSRSSSSSSSSSHCITSAKLSSNQMLTCRQTPTRRLISSRWYWTLSPGILRLRTCLLQAMQPTELEDSAPDPSTFAGLPWESRELVAIITELPHQARDRLLRLLAQPSFNAKNVKWKNAAKINAFLDGTGAQVSLWQMPCATGCSSALASHSLLLTLLLRVKLDSLAGLVH